MVNSDARSYDLIGTTYERGRPGYPSSAVDLIVHALGIGAATTVLDLGAGTGKLTRLLVPTGAHVVAVEPMGGMRTELARLLPNIEIHDGTAESIPLPDASVDAVTVAQAFHWFQPEKATMEIHRVLRPGGGLALLWNRRDLRQPLQQATHEIVVPYRGNGQEHDSENWREGLERTKLFTPLQEQHFPHSQNTDTAGLIDRIFSFSYMAVLSESEKELVRERLRTLTLTLPQRFDLMYETTVFWCRAVVI